MRWRVGPQLDHIDDPCRCTASGVLVARPLRLRREVPGRTSALSAGPCVVSPPCQRDEKTNGRAGRRRVDVPGWDLLNTRMAPQQRRCRAGDGRDPKGVIDVVTDDPHEQHCATTRTRHRLVGAAATRARMPKAPLALLRANQSMRATTAPLNPRSGSSRSQSHCGSAPSDLGHWQASQEERAAWVTESRAVPRTMSATHCRVESRTQNDGGQALQERQAENHASMMPAAIVANSRLGDVRVHSNWRGVP